MECKKCSKKLSGKQQSYCSKRCSKLHLKQLYKKRNPEISKLHRMKSAQKKRLKRIQLIKSFEITDENIFKRYRLVNILTCKTCNNRFESIGKVKYCIEHNVRSGFTKLRFEILKRDSFTCQYCGRKAPNVILHVDHIIPVSKGGTNIKTNLVTACQDCNLGKTDVLLN